MELGECPYCNADLEEDMIQARSSNDLADSGVYECPKCFNKFEYEIEWQPFFWCTKPK